MHIHLISSCYNHAETLVRHREDWQLLKAEFPEHRFTATVANDGSTDGTLAELESLQAFGWEILSRRNEGLPTRTLELIRLAPEADFIWKTDLDGVFNLLELGAAWIKTGFKNCWVTPADGMSIRSSGLDPHRCGTWWMDAATRRQVQRQLTTFPHLWGLDYALALLTPERRTLPYSMTHHGSSARYSEREDLYNLIEQQYCRGVQL